MKKQVLLRRLRPRGSQWPWPLSFPSVEPCSAFGESRVAPAHYPGTPVWNGGSFSAMVEKVSPWNGTGWSPRWQVGASFSWLGRRVKAIGSGALGHSVPGGQWALRPFGQVVLVRSGPWRWVVRLGLLPII